MGAERAALSNTTDVATPRGARDVRDLLLQRRWLLAAGARAGILLSGRSGRPLRFGSLVVAAGHGAVSEILARDLDFLIAPVNAAKIQAVNGPFILGMDRDARFCNERAALYSALRRLDHGSLAERVREQSAHALGNANGSIDVVGNYARPIAARTAMSLVGLPAADERLAMDVARAIFCHTFLNLADDKPTETRALRAATLMRGWFEHEIARRRASGLLGHDLMGELLKQELLDDDGVRRTLGGIFVGAIDTTAAAVAKIMKIFAADPKLLEAVNADRDDSAKLRGWCMEALRRWPHNPILLRRAAVDTTLCGTEVKAGDTILAWIQAAMLDPNVFPEASQLKPDRPQSAYFHFGGGLHLCAGRDFNAFQIPILVGRLLEHGIHRAGAVTWAGPFPDRLLVTFAKSAS